MTLERSMLWDEANQEYLMGEVTAVRKALQHYAGTLEEATADQSDSAPIRSITKMDPPPALDRLCQAFGLSRFERAILLLCAGMELDSSFASLVAVAQNDSRRSFPTFGLALAALSEPHWSALSPSAPLRRWRLIEVNAADSVAMGRLRIDERVLNYLAGVSHLDDRLSGLLDSVDIPGELPPSYHAQIQAMVRVWSSQIESILPAVQLCGDGAQTQRDIAAAACRYLGLHLYAIAAHAVPSQPSELDAFITLWQREAVLSGCGLLVECTDTDLNNAQQQSAVAQLCEEIRGVLVISGRTRRRALRRMTTTLDVDKPTAHEQRAMWQSCLGDAAAGLNGSVDRLGSQFSLDASAIRRACADAIGRAQDSASLENALWENCRTQVRPQLDDLAQRIVPAATWNDLVLPEPQKQLLRAIAIHVNQRSKVYEQWGFAATSSRGLGISTLFSGPSGTGKTMAGEVLANELRLDLYRIDLSQVVSKYIGETEKNLRRVFDAAEAGSAILLFDEADALFGKRSEVKDSHDRYANVEISYLLQRMEAYRGLAILTTNMKNALDTAFQRRIRFIVQFPFPDAAQRTEIWRRAFPSDTPLDTLNYSKLARLQVAGGTIRNIAMNAAFLAADACAPVQMLHLLQATRNEYAKLDLPLTENEIGGWR
jgi:ATPase family associated with various cellular activities (AAA)